MLVIFGILFGIFILSIWLIERMDSDVVLLGTISSFFGIVVLLLGSIFSYFSHASDLGVIRGQETVVQVYKERVEQLEKRLDSFNYPKQGIVSLNADSPVASIVEALSHAETSLARTKERLAEATVSIEKRKAGPYSFIVDWMGES